MLMGLCKLEASVLNGNASFVMQIENIVIFLCNKCMFLLSLVKYFIYIFQP